MMDGWRAAWEEPGRHLQLHNVGVQRTLSVVQQLPSDDSLAGTPAALQELDGHLLLCFQVYRQLHKCTRSPASPHDLLTVPRIHSHGFPWQQIRQE